MKRRGFLSTSVGSLVLLALVTSLPLTGCSKSNVKVSTPLKGSLKGAVLSLQVTSKPSVMRFISPRQRYAKRLNIDIKNALIHEGFVLKQKTADYHLHVEVVEITTGGTGSTAECHLRVDMYDEWPGDLLGDPKKKAAEKLDRSRAVLSFEVQEQAHGITNGSDREELAIEAAAKAVEDVVTYLARQRG